MNPGDHVTVEWGDRTIHGVVLHVFPALGQVEVWDGDSYVITDMEDVRERPDSHPGGTP